MSTSVRLPRSLRERADTSLAGRRSRSTGAMRPDQLDERLAGGVELGPVSGRRPRSGPTDHAAALTVTSWSATR
jgi:hypothetical protein